MNDNSNNISHYAAVVGVLFELSDADNPWIEQTVGPVYDKVRYKGKKNMKQTIVSNDFENRP